MPRIWIYSPHFETKHIAYQIICGGYIPYHPYGGRYVMDDFGNLTEALPYKFPQLDHYYNQ